MNRISIEVHAEPHEADREVSLLRQELSELDLDLVDDETKTAPPELVGSRRKSGDPVTLGLIVVVLLRSPVMTQLGHLLRDWVSRDRARRLTVRDGDRSIEIVGPVDNDKLKAIETFFRKGKK